MNLPGNENGVAYGLPFAEYLASPGVSVSALKKIHRSPAHYRHAVTQGRPDTAALLNGRIVHTALLEPWLLPSLYAVEPKLDKRTKAGKAEYAAWRESLVGQQVVSADEWAAAQAQATAIANHPIASKIINRVPMEKREVSAWSPDPETGQIRRTRFDLPMPNGVLVDVKNAAAADPEGFAAACARFGYHYQAAQYMDVANDTLAKEPGYRPFTRFAFIVCEKEPPYAVGVYYLSDEAIELGRERNRQAYRLLLECEQCDLWPDYTDPTATEIQTIDLPRWAYRQEEQYA